MTLSRLILSLYLGTSALCLPALSRDWTFYANRLTGYSDFVRSASLKELKRMKDLDKKLEAALSKETRFLAMDVISALNLKGFVPSLLKKSQFDENGAYYLTLNTLIDDKNIKRIRKIYLERLRRANRKPLPEPVQVVLLDTLARMGTALGEPELLWFAQNHSHDTKSAVIAHARNIILRKRKLLYPRLFAYALAHPAESLRFQSLFALKDAKLKLSPPERKRLGRCLLDPNKTLRELCKKVLQPT